MRKDNSKVRKLRTSSYFDIKKEIAATEVMRKLKLKKNISYKIKRESNNVLCITKRLSNAPA